MKRFTIKLLKSLKLYSIFKKIQKNFSKYLPWRISNYKERFRKKLLQHKKMIKFYSKFIQKGDLCFDVGANIGEMTEIFLELGTKVICIEPQPECLKQLYRKFGNNKNVIIVNKAVGEREGVGKLAICERAPTISTMSKKWKNKGRFSKDYKWTKIIQVPITTLDTLIRSYGLPKFCKIDVEGFEELVLKGLTKPIPYLSFEFTKEFLMDIRKCVVHLESIDQVKFNFTIGYSMKFIFSTWTTHEELFKKLDSLKENLSWGDIYVKFL